MHRECGFIRLSPDKSTISLLIAQNSGIVTVEEATIGNEMSLTFISKDIARMTLSKEPAVTKVNIFINENACHFTNVILKYLLLFSLDKKSF